MKATAQAIEISEGEFRRYEEVRQCGLFNMMMDSKGAARRAGLDIQRYFAIIDQYDSLDDKWPHIRKEVEERCSQ